MTNADLARWQFAFTSINHCLFFVPAAIGLAFLTALLQTTRHHSGPAAGPPSRRSGRCGTATRSG